MAEATLPNESETKHDKNEDSESKLNPDNYLFVVSLDFGTTFSGYAFSSRNDFQENPIKIQTNQEWKSRGTLISLKTSTSILITKDGSFVAFGYEAEDEFYSRKGENNGNDVMLFRRFKMKLHNRMVVINCIYKNLTNFRY